MNKDVLMLLKNHFINDNRVYKEALSLSRAGYHVQINCLYDKGLLKEERFENVTVNRLQYISRKNPTKIMQIIALISFAFKSMFNNATIIHCHDIDVLPIGALLKLLSFGKKKLVYDAHEYEVERIGIKGYLKYIFQVIEKVCIKLTDANITVSDSIANEYVRLYDIKKPHVIFNCPHKRKNKVRKNLFREKFNINEHDIIFLYQGSLSKARGVKELVEVFKNLENQGKSLVFMGYGPLEKYVMDAAAKSQNIFYHETVSENELLDYTASADIGLVFIENSCLSYYYCAPNKFFEYVQAGIPVIISDLHDMKKIVAEYKNGLVSENLSALQDIVRNLSKVSIEKMTLNMKALQELYTWEKQETKLKAIYKSLDKDGIL